MNERIRLVDGDEIEIPAFTIGHLDKLTSADPVRIFRRIEEPKAAEMQRILRTWATKSRRKRRPEPSAAIYRGALRIVSTFLRDLRDSELSIKSVTLTSLMWHLQLLRKKRNGYQIHSIRQWYAASANRYLDGFDDEVVFALNDLRIEGNTKGFAVLSSDPEEGPLSEFEEAALRRALMRDNGPIEQRAALWLALAFGTNPANLAFLREGDFVAYHFPGDTPPAYFLNIPRIKKRQPPRTEFKKRSVDLPFNVAYDLRTTAEMAEEMRDLVSKNAVYGAIADQVRALPQSERPSFLEARLAMIHTTPHGQCSSNIAESPCASAVSCLGGCRHYLRRKGDEKSRKSLLRIEDETLVALQRARETAAEGKHNAENWVRSQETVLRTTRAALAIDDDSTVQEGVSRHITPDGPMIGKPL